MNIIQQLIDGSTGGTVVVPGGTYDVDAVNAPIVPKSDMVLDLTSATLTALPTDQLNSKIIWTAGNSNIQIIGGTIIGERDRHLASTKWDVGGWGMGINIGGGSRNVKVHGTKVSRCFADGVYVHDAYDVEIANVVSDGNRRQGMSVIHCDGLHVIKSQFSNTGGVFPGSKKTGIDGTPPGDGIDLECDDNSMRIANVLIEKNVFYGNSGACVAFGSPGRYTNCRVTSDNDFDMTTQPIWAGGNAAPLGTSWYAFLLNRTCGTLPNYLWWYYQTSYYHA